MAAANGCFFEVKVIFAGLNVAGSCELADGVRVEQILENNLIAEIAQLARDVVLGTQPDHDVKPRPLSGLSYRVRGEPLLATPDHLLSEVSRRNAAAIDAPKDAFRRAMVLLYAVDLIDAGMFVTEIDDFGKRRLHSYYFDIRRLSVHYDAAWVWDQNCEELRTLYRMLTGDDYFDTGDGRSLLTAIDRLGRHGTRGNPIDSNLDLCIGTEIAFLFGVRTRDIDNENIAQNVRENARVFFGDGEFFWGRDDVLEIVRDSYRERSNTVHGRKFAEPERIDRLIGLNARLREVLKAALRAYAERRPGARVARAAWLERRAALESGEELGPIFL